MVEGLCFTCGSPDHAHASCPIQAKYDEAQALRANATTAALNHTSDTVTTSTGRKLAARRLKVSTFVGRPISPLLFPCSQPVVPKSVSLVLEEAKAGPVEYVSSLTVAEVLDNKLDGSHLIVKCTLVDTHRRLESHALVDCGATGFSVIDREFAHQHNLLKYTRKEPCYHEVINAHPIDSGDITRMVKVKLDIN